jgi:hypothetical protein
VIELSAAVGGIVIGGRAGLAVAAVYLGLALVAGRLLVRAPGTNCGCLGASDAPVSVAHVVVDGAAVLAAVFASLAGSPLAAAGDDPWARLAFVIAIGCCAWLAAQILDALPALTRAARAEAAQ